MNSFVSARMNVDVFDEKYQQWLDDPSSIDADWGAFFEGFEIGTDRSAEVEGASVSDSPRRENIAEKSRLFSLIYNYRSLGHTQAHVDPLAESGLRNPDLAKEVYGVTDSDLDENFSAEYFQNRKPYTVGKLIEELEKCYCGYAGFDYMHIQNPEVRYWIREKIENRFAQPLAEEGKLKKALKWLMEAELFESFLGKKFIGEKRFSLEGGEGALVLLNTILEGCPSADVQEIEMGMAHRGRLNILGNFVRKRLRTILREFTPNYIPDIQTGDGDVKYHLGYENVRQLEDGQVRVSLAANPSHLEAVNAVVEGKARARQRLIGDDGAKTDRKSILPILIHGDAAFAGQGSVAELLNLSQLPGYRTGGTIHLIINNQIGFTTMPEDARSSMYATDVAKMIEAPIIHVNGERPEELIWAAEFALEYRQKFGGDIVIDMYCYRRQGHNENDLAAFTQPHIAKKISSRKPASQLYVNELAETGLVKLEEAEAIRDEIWDGFEAEYQQMLSDQETGNKDAYSGSTAEAQPAYSHDPVPTGSSIADLKKVGEALVTTPEGFKPNPTLEKRVLSRRRTSFEAGENIDWAMAESLAWGTLLMEGTPVRLSGQDCRRGTFSQRHAVFYDYNNRDRHFPLRHLSDDQAKFCVYNSLLSEAAVLGFDYGYSLGCPNMLIMWEAQFGDFSNGAQVIIDQFLSSAESKWQTPSSLVMLLPHGYEGMGPEHSSARLERYLQLCAENNMIVGNFTTPAQYFHGLRRQMRRGFRKPLILMTPKSLLTKAEAVSSFNDMTEGTSFQELLQDPALKSGELNEANVKRVVFCSGKVYYDLAEHRKAQNITDTALIRVEQLYPFHHEMAKDLLSDYSNLETFVWCQEEPKNMGSWLHICHELEDAVDRRFKYAGREAAASPSEGSKAMHKKAQADLINQAFTI